MPRDSLSLQQLRELNKAARYNLPATGAESVATAWARLTAGNWQFAAKPLTRRGATVFQATSAVDRLVDAAVSQVLAARLGVRQSDRNAIVSNAVRLLSESTPLRVYRYDVQSFYESIRRSDLLAELRNNWRIPRLALTVLESLFSFCDQTGISGLPRGFAASATLAEHYLHEFDSTLRLRPDVFFYARYVDDIFLLTLGSEDPASFKTSVVARLNERNLRLNDRKERVTRFDAIGESFEYLGYRFVLHNKSRAGRDLEIGIAHTKIRRTKSRICLAIRAFQRDRRFDLLRDRIRLLTSNYFVGRKSEHEALRAGIYYSYKEVNDHAGLIELDRFLRSVVRGTRLPISKRLSGLLTPSEQKMLLRYSFVVGSTRRRMLNFPSIHIRKLTSCWQHV
jgi:hypothetical protein